MKKNTCYLFLCLLLLVTLSCRTKKQATESFDYGSFRNNEYTNNYFNLSIAYPDHWVVQNKEQVDKLVETGKKVMAGEDKNLKAIVEASEVKSAYLLTLFKYEMGAAVEYNPSFILISENTKDFPGIKEGKDYLFHTRRLLEQSQLKYTFGKEILTRKIGDQNFDVLEAETKIYHMKISQEYMTTVYKDFCLSLVISYHNEEEKQELYSILNKIKF